MVSSHDIQKNILAELELLPLPEEKKVALLNKMVELVQKRLLLRIVDSLSEEDAAELEKIAEDDKDRLFQFLQKRIPEDIEAMVQEEVNRVRQELKELVSV